MFIRSIGQVALFAMALIVLLAGCSGESKIAEVAGTITVDGQPAEKGSISFIPVDGKTTTEGGIIESGGKYTAKSAVGTMKVEIRVPKVTGKKKVYETGDSQYRDTYSESLPKKYNTDSELRLEVQPGKNEKNWELFTK